MSDKGWIKLHRQSKESELWHKSAIWWRVWEFILLTVNQGTGKALIDFKNSLGEISGEITYKQVVGAIRLCGPGQ